MTDEARKCVEALRWSSTNADCTSNYYTCPVSHECECSNFTLCDPAVAADLIESLCAELERVKRERDAAVKDLCTHCGVCVHVRDCLVTGCSGDMGEACKQCPCLTCINYNNWQWRGVNEDREAPTCQ